MNDAVIREKLHASGYLMREVEKLKGAEGRWVSLSWPPDAQVLAQVTVWCIFKYQRKMAVVVAAPEKADEWSQIMMSSRVHIINHT